MKSTMTYLFVLGTLGTLATVACTVETAAPSSAAPAATEAPAGDDPTVTPDTPADTADAGKTDSGKADSGKTDSGQADTGLPCTTKRWYRDVDGDGYGAAATFQDACLQPSGFVDKSGDCDDAKNAVHPGATELCDAVDNNCDGMVNGTLAETAACTATAGSYAGTFTMYTAEKLGTTVVNQMTCTGTNALVVDLNAANVLKGTVACKYTGSLGGFNQNQTGTITGTVRPDGVVDLSLVYTFGSGMTRTFAFKGTAAGSRVDVVNGKSSWLPNPMSAVPWEVTVNIGSPKT